MAAIRDVLNALLESWHTRCIELRSETKILGAALHRDAQDLLQDRPQNLGEIFSHDFKYSEHVKILVRTLTSYLRDITATLPSRASFPVVAPRAGGIRINESNQDIHTHKQQLRMGALSPGRVGLSHLDSPDLITWRLWAIASAASESSLAIIIFLSA